MQLERHLLRKVGVGTISPNHGRLSQMDPFDPKVNYLEGFLPTSNPQLTPALPTQPTYRLGYRLRGQSWCVEGVCLIKKLRRVLFLELKN